MKPRSCERAPEAGDHLVADLERAAGLLVDDQVGVALAEPGVGVGQAVPLVGQRADRLRQQLEAVDLDAQLALAGGHHRARRRRPSRRGRGRANAANASSPIDRLRDEQLDLAGAVADGGEDQLARVADAASPGRRRRPVRRSRCPARVARARSRTSAERVRPVEAVRVRARRRARAASSSLRQPLGLLGRQPAAASACSSAASSVGRRRSSVASRCVHSAEHGTGWSPPAPCRDRRWYESAALGGRRTSGRVRQDATTVLAAGDSSPSPLLGVVRGRRCVDGGGRRRPRSTRPAPATRDRRSRVPRVDRSATSCRSYETSATCHDRTIVDARAAAAAEAGAAATVDDRRSRSACTQCRRSGAIVQQATGPAAAVAVPDGGHARCPVDAHRRGASAPTSSALSRSGTVVMSQHAAPTCAARRPATSIDLVAADGGARRVRRSALVADDAEVGGTEIVMSLDQADAARRASSPRGCSIFGAFDRAALDAGARRAGAASTRSSADPHPVAARGTRSTPTARSAWPGPSSCSASSTSASTSFGGVTIDPDWIGHAHRRAPNFADIGIRARCHRRSSPTCRRRCSEVAAAGLAVRDRRRRTPTPTAAASTRGSTGSTATSASCRGTRGGMALDTNTIDERAGLRAADGLPRRADLPQARLRLGRQLPASPTACTSSGSASRATVAVPVEVLPERASAAQSSRRSRERGTDGDARRHGHVRRPTTGDVRRRRRIGRPVASAVVATRFVIIGGGPAGNTAATYAARLGAEVTLIERDVIGGAAHLWDCIPSKTMIATGGAMSFTRRLAGDGPRAADARGRRRGAHRAHRQHQGPAAAQHHAGCSRARACELIHGIGALARPDTTSRSSTVDGHAPDRTPTRC